MFLKGFIKQPCSRHTVVSPPLFTQSRAHKKPTSSATRYLFRLTQRRCGRLHRKGAAKGLEHRWNVTAPLTKMAAVRERPLPQSDALPVRKEKKVRRTFHARFLLLPVRSREHETRSPPLYEQASLECKQHLWFVWGIAAASAFGEGAASPFLRDTARPPLPARLSSRAFRQIPEAGNLGEGATVQLRE